MKRRNRTKQIKAPNLLVLIFLLILLASLLTYLIPAGQFDSDTNNAIITGTYHSVTQTPVSPWRAICMIFDGMTSSGWIIAIILLMGGSIGTIIGTGAVENLIGYAVYKLRTKKITVLIPCCMFLMSFLASFGGNDAFVAFVTVGVVFARKLKLDPIVAVAVFFLSSFVGFFSGPFIMSAQLIGGVPPLSGFGLRICVLIAMTTLASIYTVNYSLRISKNPAKSLMGNTDWLAQCTQEDTLEQINLDRRALLVVLLLIGTFVALSIALPLLGFGYGELIGLLLIVVIISELLYKKSPSQIADDFTKGVMSMAGVALVIGMAKTISLVLESGNILHTLIHIITLPLSTVGPEASSVLLFLSNAVINIFIPSSSGQAAVVLPLMMPIGTMLDIPAQVVISSFIYGDGLTNLCIPTFSALIGGLTIAKVPYGKWLRFILPFIILSAVCLSILLMILTAVGWTGL